MLWEETLTERELYGAHRIALRIFVGMMRSFGKWDHGWLIAQAASVCSM